MNQPQSNFADDLSRYKNLVQVAENLGFKVILEQLYNENMCLTIQEFTAKSTQSCYVRNLNDFLTMLVGIALAKGKYIGYDSGKYFVKDFQ